MKKGEKKFLIVLIALFVLYVATDFLAPKPVDWRVTFNSKDKNPMGAFILVDRSDDLFQGQFEVSTNTISELTNPTNLLILSDVAQIAGADYRNMISYLNEGAQIFIGANEFSPVLKDSLALEVAFSFHILDQRIFESATSKIELWDESIYEYPFSLISNYFILEEDSEWEVLATLEDEPVLITRQFQQGQLTLCSTPYVFTNFGLLINENYPAAAKMLSILPDRPTHYTMFYHLGKAEATTPLRYFLRQPPLRWSMYLGLFCIVVFLLITSRRTQRAIPIVAPPLNSTVNYVKTLGAVFYQERNHKKAAQRSVSYFLHSIKEKYYLEIDYSEKFYKHLSAKSGIEINNVINTFELILRVRDQPSIDEKTLLELIKKIEQFG